MTRAWLASWLAERRNRLRDSRIPTPLRQSVWCANGLHGQCQGWTMPHGTVMDCLCPCHAPPRQGPRARTAPTVP